MTLAELADSTGVAARTIRFYISRGLLDGPEKAGRGAEYTGAHQKRLEQIAALQGKGRTLSEVAAMLSGERARPMVPGVAWTQYQVAEDVAVWVRADASPWRMKRIRAAFEEMAARLKGDESAQ